MPKVVIQLEAQDKQALARIREFARGVDDTIGKLKASNPALEGTRVKVSQLADAKGVAFRATQQWSGVLQVLPGQLGAVASQATGLASALSGPGGVVVGLTAAAVATVGLAKSLGNDIERLKNLSLQTGLAVSSLQAFEQAAKEAGESPDTLVQGLGRVNQAINDVLTGAPNAGKAFEAIGVNLRDLVKEGASTEQILEATAKALAAIPDPTARAAAQMELFGTRGRSMSIVLDTLAKEGLGPYVQAMRDAGIVTSDATNRMATDIDALADRFDRAMTGMIQRAKAGAAAITLAIAEAFRLLPSTPLVPFPSHARGAFEPTPERPPPQDRSLPQSAAVTKAAADAEQRAQAAASAIAQIFADLDAAIADQVLESVSRLAVDLTELDAAAKQAEASFRDYTVTLGDLDGELESTDQAVTVWKDHWKEFAEFGGSSLIPVINGVRRELEGLPPSIMAVRTEGDEAFFQLQRAMEATEGSVERLVRANQTAATESTTAWKQFGTGLTTAGDDLHKQFQDWETIGRQTAGNLFNAFDDSFFALMKGNLDDFDDIWKTALDAVLRQISAFLASETIKTLVKLVSGEGLSFGGGGAGSAGGVGAGGVSLGPIGVTTTGVTVFGTKVVGFGGAVAGAGAAGAGTTGIASGAAGAGVIAGDVGIVGTTPAVAGAGLGATAVGVGGIAAIAAVIGYGIYDSIKSRETRDARQTASHLQTMLQALDTAGRMDLPASGTVLEDARADLSFISEYSDKVGKLLGLGPEEVKAFLAQQQQALLDTFATTTASVLAGRAVDQAPILAHQGGAVEGGGGAVDLTGPLRTQGQMILGQLPGFHDLGSAVQANFAQLAAGFEGNRDAMITLVQTVSEQLPEGLRLSAEEAAKLVDQGLAASETFQVGAEAVTALSAELLNTEAGVGIAAEEAAKFAAALASGVAPTEQFTGLFGALASEHGPGFTEAVAEAVTQLGLSNEEAQKLLESIKAMSEGVEVPVVYQLSTRGTPPPGAAGPSIPAGTPDGRFHGGWAGVPGFAPGGWVTDGLWDRDSVLAALARDEFVVRNQVTRLPGVGAGLEHLNATGHWPGETARGATAATADGAARSDALLAQLVTLQAEANRIMKELARAGRLAGSAVI